MTEWLQITLPPATLLLGFVAVASYVRLGLHRLEDRMDARFDKMDARFDRLEEIVRGHGERILVLEVAVGISRAQMTQGQLPPKSESGS